MFVSFAYFHQNILWNKDILFTYLTNWVSMSVVLFLQMRTRPKLVKEPYKNSKIFNTLNWTFVIEMTNSSLWGAGYYIYISISKSVLLFSFVYSELICFLYWLLLWGVCIFHDNTPFHSTITTFLRKSAKFEVFHG